MAGVYLGIDYGDVRIGVAVSDVLGMMAHPLETVPNRGRTAVERVVALAGERGAEGVVIGLPKHMDGREGASAEKARAFGKLVGEASRLAVYYMDERLSTAGAQRLFQDAGVNTKKSRGRIDVAAAQWILQNFLDARQFAAESADDSASATGE